MAPLISLSINDRAAHVQLNRPGSQNAFSFDMIVELREALTVVKENSDFLLLTAAGDDFSVGRERQAASNVERAESLSLVRDVNRLLRDYRGIFVAAVRGRALGFACGLVVQSDLAIAAEGATFAFNEIRFGFPPLIVMSYLGAHLLHRHALELVLTGRDISASEARSIGLVNYVVADHAVEARAEEIITGLRQSHVEALKRLKEYARAIRRVPDEERSDYALQAQLEWFRNQPET